jgi:hypothetical protein
MALVWISALATIFAIFYIALLIGLGWATWKNGRKFMFFAGFLLPIFWIVGGLLAPKPGSEGEVAFMQRYGRRRPDLYRDEAYLYRGAIVPEPTVQKQPGLAERDRS